MDFFFNPSKVAVIGASGKKGKIGYEIMNSLLGSGVKIFPVNLNESEIMGIKCYKDLLEIKDQIDLMVISLNANQIPEIISKGCEKGVKGSIIISGGFGEIGKDGKMLEDKVVEIAKNCGMRIIGPNCIGVFSSTDKFDTFFQSREAMKRPGPGPVSFMTQSGTYGVTLLELLEESKVGVSKFVSLGNKIDVNENDLLDYFYNDNKTKIIAAYLEGFSNGRLFFKKSFEISKKKPIVVLKAGKNMEGTIAAKSHTGALAENYIVFEGAAKQSGIIVVDDIEEMVDILKILAFQKIPKDGRVLLITNGAGPCVVTADAIGESKNLKMAILNEFQKKSLRDILPEFSIISNPLDLTGSATPEWYEKALEILKDGDNIDIIILYFVIPNAPIYRNIDHLYNLFSKNWMKTLVVVISGGEYSKNVSRKLEEMGIPVITTARRVVNALDKIVEYSRWKNHRD
ncbi:MAG: CoA-binding protein [Thermoplasmata archaeon]